MSLRFGLTEKALFQVIWGLLLVYADWEQGGVCLSMSKSVHARVFVRSNDSFNFPLGWIKSIVVVIVIVIVIVTTRIIPSLRIAIAQLVARPSDWKTRGNTDAGSSPRCGKGLFSQSQHSVQTLLRCPQPPVCNRMHQDLCARKKSQTLANHTIDGSDESHFHG